MHAVAITADDEVFAGLRNVMDHSNWHLHRAGSLEEVTRLLEDAEWRDRLSVALCGPALDGGGWRDLVARLRTSGSQASVVVVDRQAGDELWRDVLSSGGFEVLRFPPDPRELFRVVTDAWRRWRWRPATS
jgi:DNA-binding response OmpR family regulator